MITNFALAIAFLLSSSTLNPGILEHARSNYEAIVAGQKQLSELSPGELADLRAFIDLLHRQQKRLTPAERCVAEEVKRAGGSPTDLDQRVIDLKCRKIGGE